MTTAGTASPTASNQPSVPALSRRLLVAYWLLLLAGAAMAFTVAVTQSRLVYGTILVLIAAIFGMIAVFAPIFYVAAHLKQALNGDPVRASRWHFIASAGGSALGLGVTSWGIASENQAVTAGGVLVLVHGGALLSDWLNQQIAPKTGSRRSGGLVLASTLGLVFATIVTANEGRLSGLAAFFTGFALLMLVVLKLSVVQYVESGEREEDLTVDQRQQQRSAVARRRKRIWWASAAALPVGVLAAWLDGWAGIVWSGSLLIGGLSVLGLLVHNGVPFPWADDQETERTPRPATLRTWALYGIGFLVLGLGCVWWLAVLAGSWLAALGVTLVIFLVGAFFVLPGETVFGAFLIGLLAIWIAEDTDAATPAADNAAILEADGSSEGWIVAVGDSYISGEGAPDFFAQTNTPGANTCRRAPTAYPALVGRSLGMRVESFACSGAKTVDLRLGEPDAVGQMPDSPDDIYGGERQFRALEAWLDADPARDVDLVLLSVGGNDSGFGDVITSCLLPGADCSDVETAFLERVDGLDGDLGDVYDELAAILAGRPFEGGTPPILVTQYPDPIGDGPAFLDECNLMLSQTETPFIRRFRDNLNDEVGTAVEDASERGIDISLVPSGRALDGHELCEDNAYVNWLRLSPPDGNFFRTLNPSTWKNGSLHPGPDGHCITARYVIDAATNAGFTAVGETPDCAFPADESTIAPVAGAAAATLPPVCEGLTDPGTCTEDWIEEAANNAGANAVVVIALGVTAGMFLGAALSRLEKPEDATPRTGLWFFARTVWLEYDKVANGNRALRKHDPNRYVPPEKSSGS